jgi:hypothetical protein
MLTNRTRKILKSVLLLHYSYVFSPSHVQVLHTFFPLHVTRLSLDYGGSLAK